MRLVPCRAAKGSREHEDVADNHGLQPGDMLTDGSLKTDDLTVSDAPHVVSYLGVESTHIAVPELSHPGESQSNGLTEKSVRGFTDQSEH